MDHSLTSRTQIRRRRAARTALLAVTFVLTLGVTSCAPPSTPVGGTGGSASVSSGGRVGSGGTIATGSGGSNLGSTGGSASGTGGGTAATGGTGNPSSGGSGAGQSGGAGGQPNGSGGGSGGSAGSTGPADAGSSGGATQVDGGTEGPGRDAGGGGTTGGGGAGGAGGGGGVLVPAFSNMWSATPVATVSQQLMTASGNNTYRTYVRTYASGKFNWAFWFSNGQDSTYASGQAMPNKIGGTWRIEAAYVADAGATHSGGVAAGTSVRITFGGNNTKSVQPGEKFWSDPVSLNLPAGHDLAFTWTLSGTGYPFVGAAFHTSYRASNASIASQESAAGFSAVNGNIVAPQLIAYDRPIANRFCFLGDSITQGVGTGSNTYGYWAAKIADGLKADVGVWNLGSGWARATDAASDGYWLFKAKQCAEVAIILGVNDFASSSRTSAQVLSDLATIVTKIKQNNGAAKVIVFTVPPFNLTGSTLTAWRATNDSIRATPPAGTDRVFDIAAILGQASPNDGMVKTAYLSNDAHPNDAGGTAVANAFLDWYR